MPVALSISLPLVMAVVLIASGVAKLRHPDDLRGWRDLGVPTALQRRWLLQLHPWGEIVLGIALALLGGALGLIAAVIAVVLMGTYTVLIVRTLRRTPDASCACFGEPAPVTGWTVVRNGWLTALATGTALTIWANPLWGGAVIAAGGSWLWLLALAVAAVTVFVVVLRGTEDAAAVAPSAGATASEALGTSDNELDYVRSRTPAVPVTLGDGTTTTLRHLTQERPLLLLAVQAFCASCQHVITHVDDYRALLPEVDVRFLVMEEPKDTILASSNEPQTVHDPNHYVGDSLTDGLRTPTAILFGIDGLLAGGPETGADAIDSFVDDIYESLHGTRPARE